MENHPIPQDVTGFKFRLIGSMTVKQFLYVLAGGALAVIVYILPLSIFIRLPLSILFGSIGAALAFIPIEGRPLDVMMINFLKALPAENQYIYRKRGADALIYQFFGPPLITHQEVLHESNEDELARKRELLKNTLKLSSYKPDANDISMISNVSSYFNEPTTIQFNPQRATVAPPPPIDEAPEEDKKEDVKPKTVSPPPASDMALRESQNEGYAMPVPSPIQRSADTMPQGYIKPPPITAEVREEVEKPEEGAMQRVQEAFDQVLGGKKESPQILKPDIIITKKKVPATDTTTPEGSTIQQTAGATTPIVIQNTGAKQATAPQVIEKRVEVHTEAPPRIETVPVPVKDSNSDEALRQALEEIQQIGKPAPSPKIEPIKKEEVSFEPKKVAEKPEEKKEEQGERPSEEAEKKTAEVRRAALTPLTPPVLEKPQEQHESISEKTEIKANIAPFPQIAESSITQPTMEEPAKDYALHPIQKAYNTVKPNESQNVKIIASAEQLKAGFPQLPDVPNIVLGIIKDPRGKVLPNVLVEIMNNQGTPVRAFKTNALGQFTAATPLASGEYDVVLEDPRKTNEFENIHITLDGSIFQPLEIFSVDDREKLRRELFGHTPIAAGA